MKNKDIDYTNINYTSFSKQLKRVLYEEEQADPAKITQIAKLNTDKAKLEVQIATLQKKKAEIDSQIEKLSS